MYRCVVLAKRPQSTIVPGETFTIKSKKAPTKADLKDGDVIFQTHYLSLDPAMRGWLNDTRSYIPPVKIGEVMRGVAVGQVIESKSIEFPVGTYAIAMVGWSELGIVKEKDLQHLDLPKGGKLTDALGVLGLTGLTAYFGLLDVGKVKAGDFVVVSGAAGATGSVVGQIAKLKGATVLGIAGSDDKVQWLKDLGFDDALNYKAPDFFKKFRAATKGLIDVFFDNVGGEILDLALSRAKPHARFVMCGGISQYNATKPEGPKVQYILGAFPGEIPAADVYQNYLMIVSMRIRMEGFVVFDYESRAIALTLTIKSYAEARKELSQWLSEGKIQRKETIIRGGLPAAEKGLVDLFNGVNTGKLLVEVKPQDQPARSML